LQNYIYAIIVELVGTKSRRHWKKEKKKQVDLFSISDLENSNLVH